MSQAQATAAPAPRRSRRPPAHRPRPPARPHRRSRRRAPRDDSRACSTGCRCSRSPPACSSASLAALLQVLAWQANGRAADNTEQLCGSRRSSPRCSAPTRSPPTRSSSAASSRPSSAAEYDDGDRRRARGRSPTPPRPSRPTARRWRRSTPRSTAYTSAIAQARDNNRQGFPIGIGVPPARPAATCGPRRCRIIAGAGRRQHRAGRGRDGRAAPVLAAAGRPRCAGRAVVGQPPARAALPAPLQRRPRRRRDRRRRAHPGRRRCSRQDQTATTTTCATAATRTAVDEAAARTAANDAKANESLRLINRGLGRSLRGRAGSTGGRVVEDQRLAATRSAAVGRLRRRCTSEIVELDDERRLVRRPSQLGHRRRADDGADRRARRGRRSAAQAGRRRRRPRPPTDALRSAARVALVLAVADPAARAWSRRSPSPGDRPATEGVRMRPRLAGVARRGRRCSLAGCGGYDDTAVPEPDAAAAPSAPDPAAPSAMRRPDRAPTRRTARSPSCDRAPRSLRDPRAGRLVAGVAADTYLLGSRNPFTGQIEGFDIDMVKAIADAIFGTDDQEPRAAAGDHRGRPDPAPRRRGDDRHRGAQHDDQLRALGADRVLGRVLPTPARRCWSRKDLAEEGIDADRGPRRASGSAHPTAPPASTTSRTSRSRTPIPVTADQPHRLPGQVPERRGRRDHRRRHRARRPRRPGPVRRGARAGRASPTSPTASASTPSDDDLVRFINGVLEEMRADGRWQAVYDNWLRARRSATAAGQPRPVYGR